MARRYRIQAGDDARIKKTRLRIPLRWLLTKRRVISPRRRRSRTETARHIFRCLQESLRERQRWIQSGCHGQRTARSATCATRADTRLLRPTCVCGGSCSSALQEWAESPGRYYTNRGVEYSPFTSPIPFCFKNATCYCPRSRTTERRTMHTNTKTRMPVEPQRLPAVTLFDVYTVWTSFPARSRLRNEGCIVERRPVVSVLTRHITYFNNFHCYCNKQHKTANTEQRGLHGNKRIKHTYRWLSWHDHLLQSQLQISLPPSLCPNSFPIYFSESPLLPIIRLP